MVSEREEENIILRKTQAKKSPPRCCAELPERLQGPASGRPGGMRECLPTAVGEELAPPAALDPRSPRFDAPTPVIFVGAAAPGREQVPFPLWLQMLRGSIPTRGKRATNLTLLFVAKAGHEAFNKMSGGHLVARVGRDLRSRPGGNLFPTWIGGPCTAE